MSQLELQALKFFNDTGKWIVSYKNQRYIDNWEAVINPLLFQSPIVKKTLLATSSMLLLHFMNLNTVDSAVLTSSFSVDSSEEAQAFFRTGTKYLQELIDERKHLLQDNSSFGIESIIVNDLISFGCLLIYNHKLVPLISATGYDVISMAKEYSDTRNLYSLLMTGLRLESLFFPKANPILTCPPGTNYWFTRILELEIMTFTSGNGSKSNNLEEYFQTLQDTFLLLKDACYAMAIVRFPFPLIACLTNFSDKYRQLLRNGDEFALRLLFIYSCLCVISRISLNRNDNIFVDYIMEFKTNFFRKYGDFSYPIDRELYHLVTRTNFVVDFGDMSRFHPLQQCEPLMDLSWLEMYIRTLEKTNSLNLSIQ